MFGFRCGKTASKYCISLVTRGTPNSETRKVTRLFQNGKGSDTELFLLTPNV